MQIEIKCDGALVMAGQVAERTFSTGSRGFQLPGKVTIGQKQYQTQVQLVEIGSKGKAPEPAKAPAAAKA